MFVYSNKFGSMKIVHHTKVEKTCISEFLIKDPFNVLHIF